MVSKYASRRIPRPKYPVITISLTIPGARNAIVAEPMVSIAQRILRFVERENQADKFDGRRCTLACMCNRVAGAGYQAAGGAIYFVKRLLPAQYDQ